MVIRVFMDGCLEVLCRPIGCRGLPLLARLLLAKKQVEPVSHQFWMRKVDAVSVSVPAVVLTALPLSITATSSSAVDAPPRDL